MCGKSATFAVNYLTFCRRRAARSLLKLIKSAIANADQKGDMDLDNLVVAKLCVDQGPSLKRFMPRARGSASPILKRTCHVTVELQEK